MAVLLSDLNRCFARLPVIATSNGLSPAPTRLRATTAAWVAPFDARIAAAD